jgi:hypothetical protein
MTATKKAKNTSRKAETGKKGQRNVAVYLGYKNDIRIKVLDLLCEKFGMTRSKFFRNLYYQYLRDNKLMNKDNEIVRANVRKLNKKRVKRIMPRVGG